MVDEDHSVGRDPSSLSADLWATIFSHLSSHVRRVVVPLVCKEWNRAVSPRTGTLALWEDVEVHDDDSLGRNPEVAAQGCGCEADLRAQQVRVIHQWLWERRNRTVIMTVDLYTAATRSCSTPSVPAPWAYAFGLALPALGPDAKLAHLILHGPGALTHSPHGSTPPYPTKALTAATDAAGAVLLGAFSLPSLETLHVYDIPWAASLLLAAQPTAPAATSATAASSGEAPSLPTAYLLSSHQLHLTNLRELVISRCFFHSGDATGGGGGGGSADGDDDAGDTLLDAGVAEAWEALGRALAALPCLERLDMSYTHAMTYCDPARGAAAAAWPPLRRLRQLSLAHDLSVQPPPPRLRPPPMPAVETASVGSGACGSVTGLGAAAAEGRRGTGAGASSSDAAAGAAAAAATLETWEPWGPSAAEPTVLEGGSAAATAVAPAEVAEVASSIEALALGAAVDAATAGGPLGVPLLTVDAAHATVELLTWLPTCTALTSLDLRRCGLEAVPMAVVHLPNLERLDLQGNPLVSMRFPGPRLERLTWLRFSLDPSYEMVYEMMAAEVGEAAATEEMMVVELEAPRLEELQVDGCSPRTMPLIQAATAAMPSLRRLAVRLSDSL